MRQISYFSVSVLLFAMLCSCEHIEVTDAAVDPIESPVAGIIVFGRSDEENLMRDAYVFEVSATADSGSSTDALSELESVVRKAAQKRKEIREGTEVPKPVVILLHEGIYGLGSTLSIGSGLSGTAEAPTIIRSYPGESATLSGGLILDDFSRIDDADIRERLSSQARKQVVVADLPRDLVPDLGSLNPTVGRRPEVYQNGRMMRPARYPNEGWLEIEDVPQSGDSMIHPGLDRDKSAVPRGRHYGRFVYPDDRPTSWQKRDDIWVHGYWTWDWADQFLRVAFMDKEKREITPRAPHHRYGYTTGQRFYFLNVLEELDAPGEWFIDTRNRKLYYWPVEEITPGSVVFSVTSEALVTVSNVEHLIVESLTLRAGRGDGIEVRQGKHVSIRGCAFANFGGTPVRISGGNSHTVSSCDIRDTGAGGISVSGGNRQSLARGEHVVENNHIFLFAQRIRTYTPAIQVGGVGNTIAHNLIHNAPHMGMNIDGNDHIIEFNEIFQIAQETGDVGAMYMGRDWTERGVVFRYNFIHDLEGPGHVGAMGIYLDDAASGASIYRNLFYKAKRAILIGGGRDTTMIENVFADCDPSIHVDGRGIGWASAYIVKGGSWNMYQKLNAIGYDSEPYASRYPALRSILDGDPAIPAGNEISGNISVGGKWLNFDNRIPDGAVAIDINTLDKLEGVESFLAALASRTPGGNIPEPPAGLPSIPYDKIGLYENEFRSF
jgi:hypothetical protein